MRVLLISDWMSNPGGSEVYFTWLREGLREAGDEVKLLTSAPRSSAGGSPDFSVYGSDRRAAQAVLQIVNPFAVAGLQAALRGFRPDVALVGMFAYHLSPAILAQLSEVPTVLTVLDYKCICPLGSKMLPDGSRCTEPAGTICWRMGCVSLPHWIRDQPRYALLRRGLRHVDRILSCSRWMQRELAINGVKSERLGLPVRAPSPGFRRAPAADPMFVFCGRLSVEKGLQLLLGAFARLNRVVPNARLRIVGDGPQRADLERLVGSLGISRSVTFTGQLPARDVERELVDAWALVAPSLWAEPFGLVALEAIVRGVPVIASERGGFADSVEDEITGMLFPNGNEDELLRRLTGIARGQAFPSHQLPEEVVSRVRSWSTIQQHVSRLRSIFTEIASVPQSRL
jgi:glycosyltransferase involved in cell wall biosynthesis